MKKLIVILLLGFVLPIVKVNAQTIYKGLVVNKQQEPVVGAAIVSSENKEKGTATDIEGKFSIRLQNNLVIISAIGYQTTQISLTNTENVVELHEKDENLEEVIVSASREQQQRKEVSSAIGVLSAKKIDETKAFGVEQLVNQVSGVFMGSSKASSNEQHFMAVRSPISTKSLFLFLEDGIPIRPVAVFNHNALLEMNNTTFKRVEVLKGPASSIYGSEAIGGSFNFITKNPSKNWTGNLGFQINTLGLQRYEAEVSNTFVDKYGLYIGGHYIQRNNGLIQYSDYEKLAISLKNVNEFSETLRLTNSFSFIDFRSDMSGSLSEQDYKAGNYESDQTFTERVAKAFRFRSTLDKIWNNTNKTSFNLIFRSNEMNQIPSYRVRQNRTNGVLNGTGSGEINSNKFNSYVGLIQHKLDFNFADASIIVGATADFSPQDYVAETINVTVNPETGVNTGYSVNEEDYILNYQADILNYAGYAQFEISPIQQLHFTAGVRYDAFTYDYDNLIEESSGVADTKVSYNNITPKFGINYNITSKLGFYSNYSQGFTPPQTSTLFRNSNNNSAGAAIFDLKPAQFHNYEWGFYFNSPKKLKADIALYRLDGDNRLISLEDVDGNYVQLNAGKTQSTGVELGVTYNFLENLWASYNGSYATHKYIDFYENNVDYSNTDMPTAPNYIANTTLNYKPLKSLLLTLEHEQIGSYNTSFENQAIVGTASNGDPIMGTTTYDGHHVFNFRVNYRLKKFEVWAQALNIFDELYAIRASYSRWSRQNTYSIGNPRAFHFGVKYNF